MTDSTLDLIVSINVGNGEFQITKIARKDNQAVLYTVDGDNTLSSIFSGLATSAPSTSTPTSTSTTSTSIPTPSSVLAPTPMPSVPTSTPAPASVSTRLRSVARRPVNPRAVAPAPSLVPASSLSPDGTSNSTETINPMHSATGGKRTMRTKPYRRQATKRKSG